MRVTLKTSAIFVVATLALMGLIASFSIRRELREYEAETRTKLVAVGEALGALFVDVGRTQGNDDAVERLRRIGHELQGVRISWKVGTPSGAAAQRGFATQTVESEIEPGEQPRGALSVYIPVTTASGERGTLTLTEKLDVEGSIVGEIVREEVLSSIFLLAALTALSLLVGAVVIGRPVAALAKQARRVASGDLTTRVHLRGRDEFALLATEMNTMCGELLTARDQLRHADRLRTVGQLASGIAHELGTPLNVVSGRAKLIVQGSLEPEEVTDSARVIVEQAGRIVATIRQLLNFARRDTGRRQPVELGSLARRVQSLLDSIARGAGVVIAVECDGPIDAEVNAAEIEQALTNLVVNAVHASRPDDEIVIRLRRDPPFARIEVIDRGSGIAAEDRPHLFEPFFTTKGAGEGTGLGLSIVAEIVRDHQGTLGFESALSQGTTFTLRLPVEGTPGDRVPSPAG